MVMIVVLMIMIMVMDIIVTMVVDIMPFPVTDQPSFPLPLPLPLQKRCSPVHLILMLLQSLMVAFVRSMVAFMGPMVVPAMVVTRMASIPAMAGKIKFNFY